MIAVSPALIWHISAAGEGQTAIYSVTGTALFVREPYSTVRDRLNPHPPPYTISSMTLPAAGRRGAGGVGRPDLLNLEPAEHLARAAKRNCSKLGSERGRTALTSNERRIKTSPAESPSLFA